MSCPLPPEVHDLIIDFLRDEEAALKACCIVSKSWVPRAQYHLFAYIKLHAPPSLRSPQIHQWTKAFPDPANSPARYTRSLVIHGPQSSIVPGVTLIRAFSNIVQFDLAIVGDEPYFSLVPLRGFSHTLKFLRLSYRISIPHSEIFGFVCSFPLLEDLWLNTHNGNNMTGHGWSAPSTSPRLTGTLNLRVIFGTHPVVRCLVDLPGGLHFTGIDLGCKDFESVTELASNCSETLESLKVYSFMAVPETPLDLSGLTKLRDVMLGTFNQNVQWITTTLQTAKSRSLQQITILTSSDIKNPDSETVLREWRNLDRLLFQLWTSRSIRLKIGYKRGLGDLGGLTLTSLPELTARGAVDLVESKGIQLPEPLPRV